MLLLAGLVLDVGGRDDRTVGQQFHARVAAVAAGMAVQKFDPIRCFLKPGGNSSSNRFQVSPASSLRAIGPAGPPWLTLHTANMVLLSGINSVVG